MIKALNYFYKNKANSLISVYEEHYVNPLVMYKKNGKFGLPLKQEHNNGSGRKKTLHISEMAQYIYLKKIFLKK